MKWAPTRACGRSIWATSVLKLRIVLEIEALKAGYGETVVLEDVALSLPERGTLAVLGARRRKTTLLRASWGTRRCMRPDGLQPAADPGAAGAPARPHRHRLTCRRRARSFPRSRSRRISPLPDVKAAGRCSGSTTSSRGSPRDAPTWETRFRRRAADARDRTRPDGQSDAAPDG